MAWWCGSSRDGSRRSTAAPFPPRVLHRRVPRMEPLPRTTTLVSDGGRLDLRLAGPCRSADGEGHLPGAPRRHPRHVVRRGRSAGREDEQGLAAVAVFIFVPSITLADGGATSGYLDYSCRRVLSSGGPLPGLAVAGRAVRPASPRRGLRRAAPREAGGRRPVGGDRGPLWSAPAADGSTAGSGCCSRIVAVRRLAGAPRHGRDAAERRLHRLPQQFLDHLNRVPVILREARLELGQL